MTKIRGKLVSSHWETRVVRLFHQTKHNQDKNTFSTKNFVKVGYTE